MSGSELALERAKARLGKTLNGKWLVEAVLGMGGMATVYSAVHRNKKRAAIKVLHPELSLNDDIRQRFLREGYVANSIGHPGIVRIDDDEVSEDGAAYLVMELLTGEPLDARAERLGGTLPADEVAALTDQLLGVLAAAHAAGVVHRDLKPENLFLTTNGHLKVLDFGIARLREASGRASTSIGSFMGTPSFMSPEQARGRWDEVGERSDIWAVGATMYTLLTGLPVHDAETVNEQLVLAATAGAPSVGVKRPDLASPVVALIDRALSRDPAARWASALDMQRELRDVFPDAARREVRAPEPAGGAPSGAVQAVTSSGSNGEPIEPTLVSRRGTGAALSTSVPTPARDGRRYVAVGLVAAGVLLAGVVIVLARRSPDPSVAGSPAAPVEKRAPAPPPSASAAAPAEPAPATVVPVLPSSADVHPAPPASSGTAPARSSARRVKSRGTVTPGPGAPPANEPPANPFDRRF